MKKFIIITIFTIILSPIARPQGCVAIRSTGGFCTAASHSAETPWMLGINNRYFKSFRHFVGTDEQKQRMAAGTEVINYQYTLDIALTRVLKNGWSISIDMPILSNARSSLYEHDGRNRYSTHSFGIGDVRLTAYKWLLDPAAMHKGNVQLGLGIKLPTGDYKYQDYFHVNDSTKVLGPVDQSIQLGDGGTGFTMELNTYYNFSHMVGVYGNFFYLVNPREQNGVSTARGGTPAAASRLYGTDVMSVPDQYMFRAGVSMMWNRLTFSAGMRDECLPARDLIGGSNGFRRPGYIISIEPGINYQLKRTTLYAYVPFAVQRNRIQSVPDKIKTQLTGVYAKGDAAFADYVVNIGCSVKF